MNKIRIVFVDFHINSFFMRNMEQLLAHRRGILKHRFILDWLIENDIEVCNLVTPYGVTLVPKSILRRINSSVFSRIEAFYVFKRNGIDTSKIKTITDTKKINSSDIVIYYGTFGNSQFCNINDVHGIKVVDQIHFYGDKNKAELLQDKGIQYYMYEVDLKKYSKLYQKNYAWFDGEFIMRPYSYEPRFQVKTKFGDRKTKAVAMGTLTKCLYPEFIETYGTEYYQPHRKMILDHAGEYPEEIDSCISEFQETKLKETSPRDFVLVKTYKKLFNFFRGGQQKSYFSFDMVEKYNDYKMFICPEDINGSYGVGTIEGMACGCAMIGWNYGAFEDMGMRAGEHYISYDGTMEDLIDKIRYYQMPENQDELEMIAKTGCAFVREKFSQGNVAREYYEKLVKLSNKEPLLNEGEKE